jgi:hypothetical protein
MTIYVNGGPVVGQPMSPFFGAQNGLGATPVIQQPTTAPTAGGMQATGVQMSLLEACSRGIMPRNANISAIAGQSVSAGISASQGDGMSVDEGLSSGNGAQTSLGVAVAPNAGNNVAMTIAGVNSQAFVDGIANVNDCLSTGPTPFNIESLVSAPTPGSTTTANITLVAGVYQG